MGGPPLKNHKNIGFLRNTGPDPLKYHKATKPAFNVGQSSAPASETPLKFRWQADDGPFIVVFGSSIPSSTKKIHQIWTPSDKTFWIRACNCTFNKETHGGCIFRKIVNITENVTITYHISPEGTMVLRGRDVRT